MSSPSTLPRIFLTCCRCRQKFAAPSARPPAYARQEYQRTLAVFSLALLLVAAPLAIAQNTELRTVRGQVIDKNDAPLPSAIVYLKDVRALTVRTYIADAQGNYRFSGLEPGADYELHAETPSLTSTTHAISSFDNRKEIVVALKVDKEKKKELGR